MGVTKALFAVQGTRVRGTFISPWVLRPPRIWPMLRTLTAVYVLHVGTGHDRAHNRCRTYDCRRIPNSQTIDQPLAVEGESIYEGLGLILLLAVDVEPD